MDSTRFPAAPKYNYAFLAKMAEKERIAQEVNALVRKAPELERLVARPNSDEAAKPIVLSKTPPIFSAIPIAVPELSGKLLVGRLPGRSPHAMRDVDALHVHGVTSVYCLVPKEQLRLLHGADQYLNLAAERWGKHFHIVEINDHQIPEVDNLFEEAVSRLHADLSANRTVYVHCVGGCGRTGMLISALFVELGQAPIDAIVRFSKERSCGPETTQQVGYVIRYAGRREQLPASSANDQTPPNALAALRLTVNLDQRGEPKELSRGGLAIIGTGRLHFDSGAVRRVAVKLFNYPMGEVDAQRTQTCVNRLRAFGVALPHMMMHKFGDRWVLLSPLFGSWKAGSKLSQPSDLIQTLNESEQDFVMQQLSRVALAGYRPSIDLFLRFRHKNIGLIPLDLDLIDQDDDPKRRAQELIKRLIQVGPTKQRRAELSEIVKSECTLRSEGQQLWTNFEPLMQPGSPFRVIWDTL